MYRHTCLFSLCFMLHLVNCARILTLIPTPSISHQIPYRALMEALVKRGHHVTLLTTDPVKYDRNEYRNLTQIDVKTISYEIWNSGINFVEMKEYIWFPAKIIDWYIEKMLEFTDAQLRTQEMQQLLKDPEQKFDLCFVEVYCPPMLAVKDRFNCSLIGVSSMSASLNAYDAIGNPSNPILYTSHTTQYLKPYTLIQKLSIVINDLYYRYTYYCKYLTKFDELAKIHFGKNIRTISEIEKDIDMLFLNVNPILGDIRPSVPAIVNMNGLHIRSNSSLPLSLQNTLDKSVNGAIYFSLGTNVKSTDLPHDIRREFLNAFKEVPYTILWKWENDTMADKPPNVIVSKWMPQQSILAHPKIKAFITQGGQQSLEEAIHYKVPMIGLPFAIDQFVNVKKIVKLGIGMELSHEKLSKEIIVETINEIIINQTYKEKISKIAELLRDQPQTALERTVWWTEYVLRHKGASHLRAPAVGVPFYEYFLLDVIVFVLGCLVLFIFIVMVLFRCLIRLYIKQCHEKMN